MWVVKGGATAVMAACLLLPMFNFSRFKLPPAFCDYICGKRLWHAIEVNSKVTQFLAICFIWTEQNIWHYDKSPERVLVAKEEQIPLPNNVAILTQTMMFPKI